MTAEQTFQPNDRVRVRRDIDTHPTLWGKRGKVLALVGSVFPVLVALEGRLDPSCFDHAELEADSEENAP